MTNNLINRYPENKTLADIVIDNYETVQQHCKLLDTKVTTEAWEKENTEIEKQLNNLTDKISNTLSPMTLTKKYFIN